MLPYFGSSSLCYSLDKGETWQIATLPASLCAQKGGHQLWFENNTFVFLFNNSLIKCELNIPPIYRSGWCSYANSGNNSTGHKISANHKGDVWCMSDAGEWYKFDQEKTVYGRGNGTSAVNGDYLGMGFYKTAQDALGVRWAWNASTRKWECE